LKSDGLEPSNRRLVRAMVGLVPAIHAQALQSEANEAEQTFNSEPRRGLGRRYSENKHPGAGERP
jgi:hypothetical protein